MRQHDEPIHIAPGSEVARLLDRVERLPLTLEKDGVLYRLMRVQPEATWASYDPARAAAGMRAGAGSWPAADAKRQSARIHAARAAGTRDT